MKLKETTDASKHKLLQRNYTITMNALKKHILSQYRSNDDFEVKRQNDLNANKIRMQNKKEEEEKMRKSRCQQQRTELLF